jgi:hypothetical protein
LPPETYVRKATDLDTDKWKKVCHGDEKARAYCAAHVTGNLVEWVGTLGLISESVGLDIKHTTEAKGYAVEVLFVLQDLVNELLDQMQRLDDVHWS